MSLYWKDITTPDNKWRGIEITVDKPHTHKINLHIESCSKRFFTLRYENQTLFWARQHYTHYGVSLIKNHQMIQQTPIVSHIHSSDIEARKDLIGSEKFKSWSKYFVASLNRIDNHFFTNGKWLITAFTSSYWEYNGTQEINKSITSKSIFDALNTDTFQYVSWFDTPNKDIEFIGLKNIDENDGRLKWWQKKAKEGTLPPILLYSVSSLVSYIVLDGHYRLKAAQLENIIPDIIVLSTYNIEKFKIEPKVQKGILKSLQNRQINKRKIKPLKQDEINTILINAYTNENIYINNTSKATQVSIEYCLNDMMYYLDKINQVELAQRLFDETDGEGW